MISARLTKEINKVFLLLFMTIVVFPLPAKEKEVSPLELKPSENKGRKGQYTCPAKPCCPYPYIIVVPDSYTDKKPAGLFMYLPHASDLGGHGNPAPLIGRFKKWFIDPYNLIGIFIAPPAKAPKDAQKKVETARYAFAQLMADYHVVAGRGLIYSTGEGTEAHGILYQESEGLPGEKYPFCSNNLNSGVFQRKNAHISAGSRMNWYLNIGETEFTNGLSDLGKLLETNTMAPLVSDFVKNGGCADIYFKVVLGTCHGTGDAVNQPSAAAFERSDAAFAPFLCQRQFNAKGISKAVELANQHKFAKALKALGPIRKEKDTAAEKKKKRRILIVPGGGATSSRGRGANFNRQASLIRNAIAKKIKEKMEFVQKIMKNDPVIGIYYLKQFKKECAGLKQGKVFEKMHSSAIKNKGNKKLLALFNEFCRLYPELYDIKTGRINPDKVEFMQKLKDSFSEESNLGKMVRQRLNMTLHKQEKK